MLRVRDFRRPGVSLDRLDPAAGEAMVVFEPSGAGKTSLGPPAPWGVVNPTLALLAYPPAGG
jgi:hypothetical protein